jgi:hypothetical protein
MKIKFRFFHNSSISHGFICNKNRWFFYSINHKAWYEINDHYKEYYKYSLVIIGPPDKIKVII